MNDKTKAVAPTKPTFKIKRAITLPLVKPQLDVPVYVKVTSPMSIGKAIGEKDAAIILNVVDLETGEDAQLLVPSVLQGILHDDFGAPLFGVKAKGQPTEMLEPANKDQKADAYVGMGFMLTKHPKKSGKQYHPWSVAELDLDE